MTSADEIPVACWSCRAPADPSRVAVEAVIRGRPRAEGGPYRVFRCPACGVENGVLAGPRGGWLLHPLHGLEPQSVLDRLLSGGERARLERARVWWRGNRERVERFRRGVAEPPPAPSPAASRSSSPPPPPPPPPPPRPARRAAHVVLGVPADASLDDVRRAFRRLAKRLHPDRAQRAGLSAEEASRRFRDARAAYEQLVRELS